MSEAKTEVEAATGCPEAKGCSEMCKDSMSIHIDDMC